MFTHFINTGMCVCERASARNCLTPPTLAERRERILKSKGGQSLHNAIFLVLKAIFYPYWRLSNVTDIHLFQTLQNSANHQRIYVKKILKFCPRLAYKSFFKQHTSPPEKLRKYNRKMWMFNATRQKFPAVFRKYFLILRFCLFIFQEDAAKK